MSRTSQGSGDSSSQLRSSRWPSSQSTSPSCTRGYEVLIEDNSALLPDKYFLLSPVAGKADGGSRKAFGAPPLTRYSRMYRRSIESKLQALGESVLLHKTPLEMVERISIIQFRTSRDHYRKVERMIVLLDHETVDVDLKRELEVLLGCLEKAGRPYSKERPLFESQSDGITDTFLKGGLTVHCPTFVDARTVLWALMQYDEPKKHRISRSIHYQVNFNGCDFSEAFAIYKPVNLDLHELGQALVQGKMCEGEIVGEYVTTSFKEHLTTHGLLPGAQLGSVYEGDTPFFTAQCTTPVGGAPEWSHQGPPHRALPRASAGSRSVSRGSLSQGSVTPGSYPTPAPTRSTETSRDPLQGPRNTRPHRTQTPQQQTMVDTTDEQGKKAQAVQNPISETEVQAPVVPGSLPPNMSSLTRKAQSSGFQKRFKGFTKKAGSKMKGTSNKIKSGFMKLRQTG